MPAIKLEPSATKLYKVLLPLPEGDIQVHFGDKKYDQYPTHKDKKRRNAYLKRHQKRENWELSGITSAGFWSRWLLWNKPTLEASIRDIERRFGVDIISTL